MADPGAGPTLAWRHWPVDRPWVQLNRNSAPRAAVCFPSKERIPLRSERNLDERPTVLGRANTVAPEPTNCVDVPEHSWMAGRIGTFLSSPILPPSDAVPSVMLNEFASGTDRTGQRRSSSIWQLCQSKAVAEIGAANPVLNIEAREVGRETPMARRRPQAGKRLPAFIKLSTCPKLKPVGWR